MEEVRDRLLLEPSNNSFFRLGNTGGSLVEKRGATVAIIEKLGDDGNPVDMRMFSMNPSSPGKIDLDGREEEKMEEERKPIEPEVLPPEDKEPGVNPVSIQMDSNLPVVPRGFDSFRNKISKSAERISTFESMIIEKMANIENKYKSVYDRLTEEERKQDQFFDENLGK